MIDIDPALRSTLGFHIGYEKDSMHAKLAGTLRQIWEPWRRHGSKTSTQFSQFYIQLPAINRSMTQTASASWLVACWLLVSPCSLPARAEGNTRSTRSWHLQERVHRAQPVKFSPTHTTLYTTMSYYWTANRAYGDRQANNTKCRSVKT